MKQHRIELEDGETAPGGRERDLAFLALASRGGDLALVQKTAEQNAQLSAYAERIESLEAQRRWLWGGVAGSALVFAVLLLRRRRPVQHPPQRSQGQGQLADQRRAA